ncbi:hypothetical protein LTSEHVI_5266 [Salmonella enterica subsp. enterica serovar Hvittingfoss str. A4-620]|nr:hypothetical protein LTSEHVI_5266 [Salmonella enterica subsp. enterica serovar Hvittingfoss str. A4-620]
MQRPTRSAAQAGKEKRADAFGLFFLRGASQEIPFKLDVYTAQFYFVQDSVVPGEVLWILLL